MRPLVHRSARITTAGALGAAATVAIMLAGCGGSSGQPVASNADGSIKGQTITLYNGQHEETTTALVAAFEKLTGAKVKVRNDDEDVLAQQIEQEGAKSKADVFYTENTPPLVRLSEKGLLSPIDPSSLAKVPTADSASDHNWIGVSARVSELVYNTNDLKPADLPTSILDLADPKWKGKLGIAPSETDFQPLVTSVAADIGDAATGTWLKALKANAGAHQDPDNETLVDDVNSGTVQLGVINHYYWYRLVDEKGTAGTHSALANFAPKDDGYLLDISGAAIMKSSRHQQADQELVAFLISAQGQQVLVNSDSWEYPIGDHVTNSKLPAFSGLAPKPFDLSAIGDGSNATKLLQQAGLL